MYQIKFEVHVDADLALLDDQVRRKVLVHIDAKLTRRPELFGKPLQETLRGYRSLRVGDYRAVFRIEKSTVKIFGIGRRDKIYELIQKRITH